MKCKYIFNDLLKQFSLLRVKNNFPEQLVAQLTGSLEKRQIFKSI